jgi:hypothetical protein
LCFGTNLQPIHHISSLSCQFEGRKYAREKEENPKKSQELLYFTKPKELPFLARRNMGETLDFFQEITVSKMPSLTGL